MKVIQAIDPNKVLRSQAGKTLYNEDKLPWFAANIPLLDTPSEQVNEVYYYRWRLYENTIRLNAQGKYEVTEGAPGGNYHAVINAPSGHHIYEGRWLRQRQYVENYIDALRHCAFPGYANWQAAAVYEKFKADGDAGFAIAQLDWLRKEYYERLEQETYSHWGVEGGYDAERGLFYWISDREGMEATVTGFDELERSFTYSASFTSEGSSLAALHDNQAIAEIAALPVWSSRGSGRAEDWIEIDFHRTLQFIGIRLWLTVGEDAADAADAQVPALCKVSIWNGDAWQGVHSTDRLCGAAVGGEGANGTAGTDISSETGAKANAAASPGPSVGPNAVASPAPGSEASMAGNGAAPARRVLPIRLGLAIPTTASRIRVSFTHQPGGSVAVSELIAEVHGEGEAWETVIFGRAAYRPSFNSYMAANGQAIAELAALAGEAEVAAVYREKAERLRSAILTELWDEEVQFFTQRMRRDYSQVHARELVGYLPWYFNLPPDEPKYGQAWEQMLDPQGFQSPYGLATLERRNPHFLQPFNHACLWNGNLWPFASSQTLTALANLLHGYQSHRLSAADYWGQLRLYTALHYDTGSPGELMIREDHHPDEQRWLAQAANYNHSTYADLVITGLAGLRPRADGKLQLNPLLPAEWRYFALQDVPYHGRLVSIIYDRDGERYGLGQGFMVYVDGELAVSLPVAGPVTVELGEHSR